MENLEKINKFMSEINPEWSTLKKARDICIKLCEIYKYDPEYNYGDRDKRDAIMTRIIQIVNSGNEEEIINNIQNDNQICIGLGSIYCSLLKQLGIDAEAMGGDVFIKLDEKRSTCVSIVKELYPVKVKERPQGFEQSLLPEIETIDKELGFIDENGYREGNYDVKDIMENETDFTKRLDKVLSDRGDYVSKVIGRNLTNVELHKYYRYLMRTAFPDKKVKIEPINKKQLGSNIQYVLMTKEESRDENFIYYLYDTNIGKFKKVTEQDIPSVNKNNQEQGQEESPCLRDEY